MGMAGLLNMRRLQTRSCSLHTAALQPRGCLNWKHHLCSRNALQTAPDACATDCCLHPLEHCREHCQTRLATGFATALLTLQPSEAASQFRHLGISWTGTVGCLIAELGPRTETPKKKTPQ